MRGIAITIFVLQVFLRTSKLEYDIVSATLFVPTNISLWKVRKDTIIITIMKEGINMGRQCPWEKEELLNFYHKVDSYAKTLYVTLNQQGDPDAEEALISYNIFKYPIVYIFIHYHYGKFEDLGMDENDIAGYLGIFMLNTRNFVDNLLDGLVEQNVFYYDRHNEIAPKLIDICKEINYILNH